MPSLHLQNHPDINILSRVKIDKLRSLLASSYRELLASIHDNQQKKTVIVSPHVYGNNLSPHHRALLQPYLYSL
jgi:hypothetical protein